MAKKLIYLKGKVSWVKHQRADDRFGDPKWSIQLQPDAESLNVIKDLLETKDGVQGLRNTLGKNEDGYYMVFSRYATKTYGGKVQSYAPPEVVNTDGSSLSDTAIGNGSDGIVRLEYYTYNIKGQQGKKGSACRWDGLRVDNLVPFEAKKDLTEVEFKKVEGLVNQPKPVWG